MMRQILAILTICAGTGAAHGQDFTGVWDYTLTTPDTVMAGVLTLTPTGGSITMADGDTAELFELIAEGDRVRFGIADPENPSKARLAVYGDIFKGRVTLFGRGSPEIRGVRRGPDGKPAFVLGAVNTNLLVRDLMANEQARAIVETHIPGFFERPQINRALDYSFRGVVNYLQLASEKTLHLIDVELSKL